MPEGICCLSGDGWEAEVGREPGRVIWGCWKCLGEI
jgi:hypothetical protein